MKINKIYWAVTFLLLAILMILIIPEMIMKSDATQLAPAEFGNKWSE